MNKARKILVSDYDQTFYLNDENIEMIKNFNGYCMKEAVEELKTLAQKEVASVSVLVNELMEDNTNE